jgi:hypothetical protein
LLSSPHSSFWQPSLKTYVVTVTDKIVVRLDGCSSAIQQLDLVNRLLQITHNKSVGTVCQFCTDLSDMECLNALLDPVCLPCLLLLRCLNPLIDAVGRFFSPFSRFFCNYGRIITTNILTSFASYRKWLYKNTRDFISLLLTYRPNNTLLLLVSFIINGAWGSVVVKTPRY